MEDNTTGITASKKEGATKQASKQTASGVGISLSVILAWALDTYTGVTLPVEVVAAVSGLIGVVGGWISNRQG